MTSLSQMKSFIIANIATQWTLSILGCIPFTEIMYKCLQWFGLTTYYVVDLNVVKRVQKRLTPQCNILSDDRGYGAVWGKWYVVKIGTDSILIISSKKKYEELTEEFQESKALVEKHQESKALVEKHQVTIYDRNGPYSYNWYTMRKIYIHSMSCWSSQETIIARILQEYTSRKHAVALLHGPPGCGKSMTGLLLTTKLKGSYCNVLKPWMPNTTLSALYSASIPTEDKPLIIAIDEFDGPLLKIHNGEIPINEKLPTLVTDKTGWNLFFDEIQRGMYPYVIIILTTNKSPEFFNELDPSYIRKGRVDLIEQMSLPEKIEK
jgi:SpoVK/Ycf46/Vps4 family AAA+-type ATPase